MIWINRLTLGALMLLLSCVPVGKPSGQEFKISASSAIRTDSRVLVTVTTTAPAECSISMNPSQEKESFQVTGDLVHEQEFDGFDSSKGYLFYVRCVSSDETATVQEKTINLNSERVEEVVVKEDPNSPLTLSEISPTGTIPYKASIPFTFVTSKKASCSLKSLAPSSIQWGSTITSNSIQHRVELKNLASGVKQTVIINCNAQKGDESISKGIEFSVIEDLKITNVRPSGEFDHGTKTVDLVVDTNRAATCRFGATSASYENMTSFKSTNSTGHTNTISGLADGLTYNYFVRCRDSYGAESALGKTTFKIKPTPAPVYLSGLGPNSTFVSGTKWATLTASTSRAAVCRYSKTSQSYSSMTSFETTNFTSHTQNITGLEDGKSYKYFIRCRTNDGVETAEGSTTFKVQNTPIILSGLSPVGELATGTKSVSMKVTTNRAAACRYATSSREFSTMTPFGTTGGKDHSQTLSNLADGVSYQYFIRCQDSDGMQSSESKISFNVKNSPLTLSSLAPTGSLNLGTKNVSLSFITNRAAACRYATSSKDYASMTAMGSTNGTSHSQSITGLSDGNSYTYYVRCKDSAGVENAETRISFNVKSDSGLTLSSLQPSGELSTGTSIASLSLKTDRQATCRYATTSKSYDSMSQMGTTNSTSHTQSLTGLENGKSYAYYVRCKDTNNVESSEAKISFSVKGSNSTLLLSNLAPTGDLPIGTLKAKLSLNTNRTATCRYATLTSSYNSMTNMTTTNSTSHSHEMSVSAGYSYNVFVRCKDTSNIESDVGVISFTVKDSKVILSNFSPLGVISSNSTSVTLSLDSNRAVNCRYSATTNVFDQMTAFSSTGDKKHTQVISGITANKDYYYNIHCKAPEGQTTLEGIGFTTKSTMAASGNTVSKTFTDPLASYAWHLKNTGQKTFTNVAAVAGYDMNVQGAYNKGISGKNVRVMVSDDGLDTSHPDLVSGVLFGETKDYVYGTTANSWLNIPVHSFTSIGHGTMVSGIIAARAGNGIGSHGVAPDVRLAGTNYLDSQNAAKTLDQLGGNFDIFNYSYGHGQCSYISASQDHIDKMKNSVKNGRNGKGIIFVKSAGNEFSGSCYGNATYNGWNSIPEYIIAAAFEASGNRSSYSSPGPNLWISGAGGEYGRTADKPAILTTDRTGCDKGVSKSGANKNSFEYGHASNKNCEYTATMNGTSSAAPNVTGVIALMLEANPNLTWRDVKYILAKTAKIPHPTLGNTGHPVSSKDLAGHVYQQGWVKNKAGFSFHNWYGFGIADAAAAVNMAQNFNSPLGNLVITNWENNSGTLNLVVPDNSAKGVSHTMNVTRDLTIEAVQMKITVNHTKASDLGVELTSPSGTKSIIININSGVAEKSFIDFTFTSNAFYGEKTKGNWTVKVIDGAQGNAGTLTNVKLNFYGY